MDQLENPYRPGAGTRPPALIGRDALIDAFGVTMRRSLNGKPGKSYMPIGLRGVGKTVLLNRFSEIAAMEGMRVAYLEASESGDFRSLLAGRLRRLLLELDAGGLAKRTTAKALRALRSFTYRLPDGSSVALNVEPLAGIADSGVLSEDLPDLLVAIGEAVREARSGALLAIDEVQYLTTEELGALIMAIHRTGQLDLPVVVVGAGLPQLPGLAGEAKSYAERLFEYPAIGSLDATDAEAALSIPAEELGVVYSPDALAEIVAQSRGFPYFLQEWGYHVWNLAARSPITEEDVLQARSAVIDHLDRNFFLVRLDRLTPKEKEYLRAMAALGPGPHRSGDIATQLHVRVETVAPRRSALIHKGMLYSPAHGDTAFTVPLFDDFLLRALPS